jgi:hypothetical protein
MKDKSDPFTPDTRPVMLRPSMRVRFQVERCALTYVRNPRGIYLVSFESCTSTPCVAGRYSMHNSCYCYCTCIYLTTDLRRVSNRSAFSIRLLFVPHRGVQHLQWPLGSCIHTNNISMFDALPYTRPPRPLFEESRPGRCMEL